MSKPTGDIMASIRFVENLSEFLIYPSKVEFIPSINSPQSFAKDLGGCDGNNNDDDNNLEGYCKPSKCYSVWVPLIVSFGILGNMAYFYCSGSFLQKRTSAYIYVKLLSATDLFICFILIPWPILFFDSNIYSKFVVKSLSLNFYMNNISWPLRDTFVHFSNGLHLLMSLDRFIALNFPVYYFKNFGSQSKKFKYLAISFFVFSFVMAFPLGLVLKVVPQEQKINYTQVISQIAPSLINQSKSDYQGPYTNFILYKQATTFTYHAVYNVDFYRVDKVFQKLLAIIMYLIPVGLTFLLNVKSICVFSSLLASKIVTHQKILNRHRQQKVSDIKEIKEATNGIDNIKNCNKEVPFINNLKPDNLLEQDSIVSLSATKSHVGKIVTKLTKEDEPKAEYSRTHFDEGKSLTSNNSFYLPSKNNVFLSKNAILSHYKFFVKNELINNKIASIDSQKTTFQSPKSDYSDCKGVEYCTDPTIKLRQDPFSFMLRNRTNTYVRLSARQRQITILMIALTLSFIFSIIPYLVYVFLFEIGWKPRKEIPARFRNFQECAFASRFSNHALNVYITFSLDPKIRGTLLNSALVIFMKSHINRIVTWVCLTGMAFRGKAHELCRKFLHRNGIIK
ncbi:unnamed protein product [Gordionus sp. m RMFG-2023]